MGYEFFISKRYLFSPRQDRSFSVITWISIGGVALGVLALVVSTAVMNGFQENLRNAIIGSLPHVTLFSWDDGMTDYEKLENEIQNLTEVMDVSPYTFQQVLLTGKKQPQGALLRGIDPQREVHVTNIASFLRETPVESVANEEVAQQKIASKILSRLSYAPSQSIKQTEGIILGSALAQQLDVSFGDTVQLISSEQRTTAVGNVPAMERLEVIGFFESGISGYDEVLAFMDYRLVQTIYRMGANVTGLGIRVKSPKLAPTIAEKIQDLSAEYITSNWADENRGMFQVMEVQKISLILILNVIVIVAAFNIISSLIMLILEKSREIAILKSLGASDRSIRKIFMWQGLVIGLLGTGIGVILGCLICWGLANFNLIEIPPGVYPGGDRIPVAIDWGDIGITTVASFLICFLITLYPSTKAARLNPVDPLRYE